MENGAERFYESEDQEPTMRLYLQEMTVRLSYDSSKI